MTDEVELPAVVVEPEQDRSHPGAVLVKPVPADDAVHRAPVLDLDHLAPSLAVRALQSFGHDAVEPGRFELVEPAAGHLDVERLRGEEPRRVPAAASPARRRPLRSARRAGRQVPPATVCARAAAFPAGRGRRPREGRTERGGRVSRGPDGRHGSARGGCGSAAHQNPACRRSPRRPPHRRRSRPGVDPAPPATPGSTGGEACRCGCRAAARRRGPAARRPRPALRSGPLHISTRNPSHLGSYPHPGGAGRSSATSASMGATGRRERPLRAGRQAGHRSPSQSVGALIACLPCRFARMLR